MSELLTIEFVAEMTKTPPDVPFAPGLARESFAESAIFATLPIATIGAKSKNGYTYTQAAVEKIVQEINDKKPEGIWGHIRPDERASRYDPPAVRWVGATIEGKTLWAKAIPISEIARQHFEVASAAQAPIGTSIYGLATLNKQNDVLDFEIETIDLASSARAGVRESVAVPRLTSEMSQENPLEVEMSDTQELVQELTGERDTLKAQIAEMETTFQNRIAEMETTYKARISELQGQLSNGWIETAVSEIKLPALRPIVAEQLEGRSFETREAAEAAVALIQEKPSIKAVAAELTKAALGPNVVVAAEQNANNWREEVVRAAESRAKKTGVLAQ